jgi:hypothetical protein
MSVTNVLVGRRSLHPLLWAVIGGTMVLTAIVVRSPLPIILDSYLHDDSFYYLKTAENLASGLGSTFDGVNPTNGYQPGWFAILASLYAAGAGHDAMPIVAILVQSALFVSGMIVLALALVTLGVDAAAAAAAIGVVFGAIVPILGWNLLESGLTFLASSLLLHTLARKDASPLAFGLALSAAALARTDHLLYVPLVAAWLLWQRRHRGASAKDVAAFLLPLVVFIGGYLLINVITTGHVMPVSGRVKAFASSDWSLRNVLVGMMHLDARESWKLGLIVSMVLVARDAWRRQVSSLTVYALGAMGICAYYQFNYSKGYAAAFWYYIPLYILFCYALALALQSAAMLSGRRRAAVAGMVVLVLLMMTWRVSVMEGYLHRPAGDRANIFSVASVLRERLKSGGAAAAWDAGILGYYGGAVTNLDGLVNSADYLDSYLSLGRTPEYIRERRFEYVVCYEGDALPGGRAGAILDDYRQVFTGYGWAILERKNR